MTPLRDFEAHLAAALDQLQAAGLRRELRLPRGIDLVSNDYLGLAHHPALRDAAIRALADGQVGSGGSRLLRGHHERFARVEARLAAFSGADAALMFGSGYAANVGLLQALVSREDTVCSDAHNHASAIDGIRLTKARLAIYPHQDLDALEDALRQPRSGRAFVFTESVFSMDGDLTPLDAVCALADRYDALVIVDEAHATGLYGGRGSGRVEELGLRDRVLATVHTGGKALGSSGAWIAGSQALREVVLNRARPFIFSTAPMPALAAVLEAGIDLVQSDPERREDVHRKAALLRRSLAYHGVRAGGESPIVPVIAGANEAAVALQAALADEGFDTRAIRPPSVPPGTARLRVTVRHPVEGADLIRFAAAAARLMHAAVS